MVSPTGNWSLYPYEPIKPLPIFFAIFVSILAAYHFYQTFIRYRWPRFGFTMMFASAVWIAGFITRSISDYNVQNVDLYISQYVLILAGPPLYAAAETFILGRLLAYLPYHAPIHPGRVLSTFIFLSVAVESLTTSGASLSASAGSGDDADDASLRSTGITLIKVGLILQAVIEIGFFALVLQLQHRCRKTGTFTHNVKVMSYVLYITSSMMLVRCIVRAVEGFEEAACAPGSGGYGNCGPVASHEWYLWVFEVANITLYILALAVFTPGKYLPRSDKQYLDPADATTERMGPGFAQVDKRPFIVTVLDPFNFAGIIAGKGMGVEKFWEQEQPIASFNFAQGGVHVPQGKVESVSPV